MISLILEYSSNSILKTFKLPVDVLHWMNCIEYGWLDQNYKKHYTFDNWFTDARIFSPNITFKYKIGTCYEQSLFEYDIFKTQFPKYEVKLIHIQQYYISNHLFLIFRKQGSKYWNYFEHSFKLFKGIYEHMSINNIISQVQTQLIHVSKQKNNGFNIVELDPNKIHYPLTISEFYKLVNYNWEKSE